MTRLARLRGLLRALEEWRHELRTYHRVYHLDVGFAYEDRRRTGRLAIRAFVRGRKVDLAGERKLLPRRFRTLPIDVIPAHFARHCATKPSKLRLQPRSPLVGGLSVGSHDQGPGTVGTVVASQLYAGSLLLTCSDVTAPGSDIFQPAPQDASKPVLVGETVAVSYANLAALVQLSAGVVAEPAAVLGLTPLTTIASQDRLTELCAGQARVWKSGRSSNVTSGIVEGIDDSGTVTIGSVAGALGKHELACPGDSGSIWMTETGEGVALHYAGSGPHALAQSLWKIADEFHLRLGG
jgi:hypothetical protein